MKKLIGFVLIAGIAICISGCTAKETTTPAEKAPDVTTPAEHPADTAAPAEHPADHPAN